MAADVAAVAAAHLFLLGVAWHLLRITLGEPPSRDELVELGYLQAEAVPA